MDLLSVVFSFITLALLEHPTIIIIPRISHQINLAVNVINLPFNRQFFYCVLSSLLDHPFHRLFCSLRQYVSH